MEHTQGYNCHILENIAEWARHMDVQMKSAVLKPLASMAVLFFLQYIKTACHSSVIREGAGQEAVEDFHVGPHQKCCPALCVYHEKQTSPRAKKTEHILAGLEVSPSHVHSRPPDN